MKKFIFTLLLAMFVLPLSAQSFRQEGKVFVQTAKAGTVANDTIKTDYVFVARDGEKLTIILSKSGKAYVWKTSKKTGRKYKMYIPEVGKKINPSAYEDKASKS